MDLLEYTSDWVRGEVYQGKIMLILGSLLAIVAIFIFRYNNELLKGMLIPISVIVLMLIGYGSMQISVRPKHLDEVSEIFKQDTELAVQNELIKATKDDNSYRVVSLVWLICIVILVILYFFFSDYYYKGLIIGGIGLFLSMLIIDSILHQRLGVYLTALKQLI